MPTVADVFTIYGPAYRERFGSHMLPSHLKVMNAIETCRTEAQGGHVYHCPECDKDIYSYHSCKNRHCPTCQQNETEAWLQERIKELLPVPYFLLTFTLPSQLREIARRNQKVVYSLMFRAAAQSLQKLANDPAYVGGTLGSVAVLHTWTKQLEYHPHIHMLVPGVAISDARSEWRYARYTDWLVPVPALSTIFSAKIADGLNKANLLNQTSRRVWKSSWVVHCKPVGSGKAALTYLATYIHRTAISNNRIHSIDNGMVTFLCRESESDHDPSIPHKRRWIRKTVTAEEFIRRFLQHTLPDNFVKVRYYGFLSPAWRSQFHSLRGLLWAAVAEQTHEIPACQPDTDPEEDSSSPPPRTCPYCGHPLQLVAVIARRMRAPP